MSMIILLLGLVAVFAGALLFEGLLGLRQSVGPWSEDAHEYDDGWKRKHRRQAMAGPQLRVQRAFQTRRDFDPTHSLMRRSSDQIGGEGG